MGLVMLCEVVRKQDASCEPWCTWYHYYGMSVTLSLPHCLDEAIALGNVDAFRHITKCAGNQTNNDFFDQCGTLRNAAYYNRITIVSEMLKKMANADGGLRGAAWVGIGKAPQYGQSYSPNSCSYRDSYFKYRSAGSQILWILLGWGLSGRVSSGRRYRLMCVWVRVRGGLSGMGVICLVCVWVRVRRFSSGQSSEVSSDVCVGEGSQIQGRAVGQGVVWGVVWVYADFLDSLLGAAGFFNVMWCKSFILCSLLCFIK